ncbi:MFS general substrate transporter [Thozetella sp. PMI_491]|nr:MFS general substrate transporter [Thozetella sp. PMI_491]
MAYGPDTKEILKEAKGDAQPLPTDTESDSETILRIPAPSSDPRDPLNWPFRKKCLLTGALTIAVFYSYTIPFNGQIQLIQQAALYHKNTVEITYFNSAAVAGTILGPWAALPLAKLIGRSAAILYSLTGCLAAQIWACNMRSPDQYGAYFAAKVFMGFFGVMTTIFAPLYVVDIWFLHQRGRAFTAIGVALSLGASASSSFSGFITASHPWWYEYWWTISLNAVVMVIVFLLLEETSWDRRDGAVNIDLSLDGWWSNRFKTFFPGTQAVTKPTKREMIDSVLVPLKIAVSPTMLLIASYDTISFGFFIGLNSLIPLWLQNPVSKGGYGFTVLENAGFSMIHFMGLFLSQFYGQLVSDKIPLWLCARRGGEWIPELRLHVLWLPGLFMSPIGLALIGCAMQYHLHWIVMGFGSLFVTFAALQSVPVTMNYVAECFRTHTTAGTIALLSMRQLLGLTITFYITPWTAAVGVGWVYGMMAFFSVFAFLFIVVLMWKGHAIRAASPFSTSVSEEGTTVVKRRMESAISA